VPDVGGIQLAHELTISSPDESVGVGVGVSVSDARVLGRRAHVATSRPRRQRTDPSSLFLIRDDSQVRSSDGVFGGSRSSLERRGLRRPGIAYAYAYAYAYVWWTR
jgi:hypothetical protein